MFLLTQSSGSADTVHDSGTDNDQVETKYMRAKKKSVEMGKQQG